MKTLLLLLPMLLPVLLGEPVPAAEADTRSPESKPLDYMIVVTGGELLEGVYPDGHTPFLTRTLRPLGVRCVGSLCVDDVRDDMLQALRFATNRAPLVIVTGGLGPTPNDITRDVLAEFSGLELKEHPDVLADLTRRFNQTADQLRANLRRQTRVPVRGGYLKNSAGTAVGLVFEAANAVIVALPGPPRELQPMARDELLPFLRRRFGVREFGCALTLRFVGAGQSLIDQTIKDHVTVAPDVTITSLFEGSRVDFTFSLPHNSPSNQARLQRLEASIREHLDAYLYAADGSTLEEVVVKRLQSLGGKLVLAEVGSGGQLAAALSGVKGIDQLLTGCFEAPSGEAIARLLQLPAEARANTGADLAQAIAEAASRLTQSPWSIAVGPAETEGSGRYVWVAFKTPDGRWDRQRFSARDSGEAARVGLVTQILDRVRRQLK